MKVIDCHTHIQTKQKINDYFSTNKFVNYAICMKALDSLIGNKDKIYESIAHDKRIFLLECIDVDKDIKSQLKEIQKKLKDNAYQIIGIKIYLGYQFIYPDDRKLYEVYKFAEKNSLTITFHCGMVDSDNNYKSYIEYSNCLGVDKICVDFPKVNFVISHFNVPDFDTCVEVVVKNDNCFTDISGIFERTKYFNLKKISKQLIVDIKRLQAYNPILKEKVMFGTDFFGLDTNYDIVKTYKDCLVKIFGNKEKQKVLYENCVRAYPKIKDFLNT